MRCKAICLIICSLLVAGEVTALEVCGELQQGELIVLKNPALERVVLYNNPERKEYKANEDGVVLVALHRDVREKVEFSVYPAEADNERYSLQIAPTKWDVQRVNGVAQHKVTPKPLHEKEILREQKDVGRALKVMNEAGYWQEGFIEPVEGRISGHFGNQRIFNGVPKNPHTGTDIAAAEGTPVKASGSGKVVLSGKDYFYTGNMVIVDHGYGLQTIYAHLQRAVVKEGDEVKQGEVIGYVGKTGRATGPHLHWGASLNNVRFRPHSLLDINSKDCRKVYGQQEGE